MIVVWCGHGVVVVWLWCGCGVVVIIAFLKIPNHNGAKKQKQKNIILHVENGFKINIFVLLCF